MEAAYTIGRTASYDRALEEHGEPVIKMGRNEYEGYGGGWVWRTAEDARRFIDDGLVWQHCDVTPAPNEFSVYELALPSSWQECCSDAPASDGVHRLWRDSVIVKKV